MYMVDGSNDKMYKYGYKYKYTYCKRLKWRSSKKIILSVLPLNTYFFVLAQNNLDIRKGIYDLAGRTSKCNIMDIYRDQNISLSTE